MAFLTGPEIKNRIKQGRIVVQPFDPLMVGPNSLDLHLSPELLIYQLNPNDVLDTRKPTPTQSITVGEEGYVLQPNILYLGTTTEWVEAADTAPLVEGRSSIGRLGMQIHMTAGVIDVGFRGQITLEMTVVHPVRIYPHLRICQILFADTIGDLQFYSGRYQDQKGVVASRMHVLSEDYLPTNPATVIKSR